MLTRAIAVSGAAMLLSEEGAWINAQTLEVAGG
ncbi:hypothetical protein C4J92_2617 [Pseudomonas sp. R3-18-08]|nr:hypothetical protein C4J92_2617 [Pseudomonas sp. R3-18-08]